MAFDLREGQGSLFKNTRKSTDKHPDYTGSIKLPDGQEHWISAWIKEGAKGKFLSLSIGADKSGQQDAPQGRRGSMKDELTDDVPF